MIHGPILLLIAAVLSTGAIAAPNGLRIDPVLAVHDTVRTRAASLSALSQQVGSIGSRLFGRRNGLDADTRQVLVSGRLLAAGTSADEVLVVLDQDGHCIARTAVAFTGHFRVALPPDARLSLHFRKPGHVEKVVQVDTHHAIASARARRLNRNVRFDVVLEPVERMPDMAYDGPVGTVSFVRGSGLMKVHHHEHLVPVTAVR